MFTWLKNLFGRKAPPAPETFGGKPLVGNLDDVLWIRTAQQDGRLDKPSAYPTSMSETEQPGWTRISRRDYAELKRRLNYGRES